MTQHNEIKIFGEQQVRSVWDDTAEEWYFAVADVVAALTDSVNPTDYIKKMRSVRRNLPKGGDKLPPPFNSDCRRQAKGELCHLQRPFRIIQCGKLLNLYWFVMFEITTLFLSAQGIY